jgi:hypothetical protein
VAYGISGGQIDPWFVFGCFLKGTEQIFDGTVGQYLALFTPNKLLE